MYKNISFQEAEFGEKKFLMYRVDDASQMDHVEVEMLKNNDIKGLLPFSSAQNNDEIKFMYEMTNKMKLSQFLGGLVRWEELYPAVQGIVAAIMDCEQYMLNEGHFVLETENIFIDLSSRKIELMFLPVENELLAQITWKDFLITLLHNLNYDMKDDIGKLETLQSYLADEKITITGNTVIDALYMVVERIKNDKTLDFGLNCSLIKAGYDVDRLNEGKKLVLITGHRRENFGEGFINICKAIKALVEKYPDVDFVYPMHLNPNVRKPIHEVFGENLSGLGNMFFIEPLEYLSFVYLMEKSNIVLTDSGGIQEEAPGLGKPVLVMRDTTERPEALSAGTVKLVGTDYDKIVNEVSSLLDDEKHYDEMSKAVNPYGDGLACSRIINSLR